MNITAISREQLTRIHQTIQNSGYQTSRNVLNQALQITQRNSGEIQNSSSAPVTQDISAATSGMPSGAAVTDAYLGVYRQLILQDTGYTEDTIEYPFSEQQDYTLPALESRLIRMGNSFILETSDDEESLLPTITTAATIAIEAYRQTALMATEEGSQLLLSAEIDRSMIRTGLLPESPGLTVNETETSDIPPTFTLAMSRVLNSFGLIDTEV